VETESSVNEHHKKYLKLREIHGKWVGRKNEGGQQMHCTVDGDDDDVES